MFRSEVGFRGMTRVRLQLGPSHETLAAALDQPVALGPPVLHVCLRGSPRGRAYLTRLIPALAERSTRHPSAILCDEHPVLMRRASRMGIPLRMMQGNGAVWPHRFAAGASAMAIGRGGRVRVVHAHGYAAAAAASSVLRAPLLLSAYSLPPDRPLSRAAVRRVARTHVPLAAYVEPTRELMGSSVEVLPCALDARDFKGNHIPEEVMRDLTLDPTVLHIGFAGDLDEDASGAETFVRAAARALRAIPFCEFVVIGSGHRLPEVEGLAHREGVLGRFRFLPGRFSLPWVLSALDAVAFPGRPVGFPWEVIEAASCRSHIVASRTPVHRELLDGAPEVAWIDEGDSEALAERFLRIITSTGAGTRRADQLVMTRRAGRGEARLVNSRPSSTGYDLDSGDMDEYEILADDLTRRKDLMMRRHSLDATLGRLADAYRELAGGAR